MPHGGLGDTGMDTGDGQVGAEGGAKSVNVDDSATRVILGNSCCLTIGIEYANAGRVVEQQRFVTLLAAMFQMLPDLLYHIGSQWQPAFLTALGLVGVKFKVRCGLGIQKQLAKCQAAQFFVTQACGHGHQVKQRAFTAQTFEFLEMGLLEFSKATFVAGI